MLNKGPDDEIQLQTYNQKLTHIFSFYFFEATGFKTVSQSSIQSKCCVFRF